MQNSKPDNNQVINPFGHELSFSQLVTDDGTIVLMGTDISSMIIDHVEEMAGKPCYRYDKHFQGNIVIDEDNSYSYDLFLHFRPMGIHLRL